VTALLLAAAPASQLHADVYSDKVKSLNPQYYLRLDEAVITPGAPASDINGSVAANLGRGASAHYQTIASTTVTTEPGGGAVPGNAGVMTDGWSVRIPNSTLASGTAPFSFNVFVKPTSFGINDYGVIFGYGETFGTSMILCEDGLGGTGQVIFDRLTEITFISNGSMNAGVWNAVGLTFDGVDTIKFYLNGTLDTTLTEFVEDFTNTFAVLGANYGNGDQRFDGGLDEFTYVNGVALSDSQMIDLQTVPEPSSHALLGLSGLAPSPLQAAPPFKLKLRSN